MLQDPAGGLQSLFDDPATDPNTIWRWEAIGDDTGSAGWDVFNLGAEGSVPVLGIWQVESIMSGPIYTELIVNFALPHPTGCPFDAAEAEWPNSLGVTFPPAVIEASITQWEADLVAFAAAYGNGVYSDFSDLGASAGLINTWACIRPSLPVSVCEPVAVASPAEIECVGGTDCVPSVNTVTVPTNNGIWIRANTNPATDRVDFEFGDNNTGNNELRDAVLACLQGGPNNYVTFTVYDDEVGHLVSGLGRALIAERFTTCRLRIDSTIPSRDFGTPAASPDRTACAAASASAASSYRNGGGVDDSPGRPQPREFPRR